MNQNQNQDQKVKISRRCFDSLVRIFLIENLDFPIEVASEVSIVRDFLNEKQNKIMKNLEFLARREEWKRENFGVRKNE